MLRIEFKEGENLVRFTEKALDLVGGRLFAGYSLGKRDA
jgi:hypothetical protein